MSGARFERLVAQGGITTGLLHSLVAMDLSGPGTVFLSQNWKFTAAVFIGVTITATARAEVVSVHVSRPVTQLRVVVTRHPLFELTRGESDGNVAALRDRRPSRARSAVRTPR